MLIVGEVSDKFVRNKQLTNSLFDDPEVVDYKPKWKIYEKKYTPKLAENIIADLECEIFVIKPLYAAQGRGIIIVTKNELNKTLKTILEQKDRLVPTKKYGSLYSYWKYDNNDFFIVEEFAQSKRIEVEGNLYDPTMRVIFSMIHDSGSIDINFVGAYWKLPTKSLEEKGSLTEKHKSKAYRKKTSSATVSKEDLDIVEAHLCQVLPKLYVKMLQRHHDYFNIIENGKIIPSQQT